MLVALILIAVTSVPLVVLPDHGFLRQCVYPLMAAQGVGIAILLNTATNIISDVIGTDAASSAFVYGVYCLFDKFANGLLLYVMLAKFSQDDEALRVIIGYAPIACAFLAFFFTWIGQKYFGDSLAKMSTATGYKN